MKMNTKHLICYLLLSLLLVPIALSQERAVRPVAGTVDPNIRQALVIGNSEYRHAGRLRNPVNDAKAIGSTLQQLGFEVTTLLDADQRKMERAIRDFGDELRSRRGVGLFYYAGHGMQFGGENYLLPTDIDPSTEEDVRYDAVPLGKLLAQMRAADNAMNVVILDACRNNPFSRSFRTFSPGLAQVNAAAGTFISFATAPGQVAADGDGNNGLFTSKLLDHLQTPGLKIEEVFKRTTADVYQASGSRQAPWVQYSVIGDFFFVPKGKSPQVPNQTALSDLQKRADAEQAARLEQQRLEAQWADWQQRMQEDYERVLAFEKQAVESNLKIESWQRFLGNWTDDNPYSQQDSELRSGARAKLSDWKNDQKVEPKSKPETEIVLSGEVAKRKLLSTKECAGCDLSSVDLWGANLSKASLNKADLNNAFLARAHLIDTDLRGARLSDASLIRADLRGADLLRADLRGADLLRADLRGADLSEANLSEANLNEANLSEANLNEANLFRADLNNANLSGANLNGAHLFYANLSIADLRVAKFCKTTMPDGSINNQDCDQPVESQSEVEVALSGNVAKKKLLETKECVGCDLSKADLKGANLEGANLEGANLEGADLTLANLKGVDLAAIWLRGVNLTGVDLSAQDLSAQDLTKANLTGANLKGANLNGTLLTLANLTGVDLTGIDLSTAILWGTYFCNTTMPDGSVRNDDC